MSDSQALAALETDAIVNMSDCLQIGTLPACAVSTAWNNHEGRGERGPPSRSMSRTSRGAVRARVGRRSHRPLADRSEWIRTAAVEPSGGLSDRRSMTVTGLPTRPSRPNTCDPALANLRSVGAQGFRRPVERMRAHVK